MAKKRLLLPIGVQDFVSIRQSAYYYVDKTARIHQLISNAVSACFLSRPRRFGKSLLCSTLRAIFEGKRELFKNLAIDSLDWEWKKHPVITLDLNPGDYSQGTVILTSSLENSLNNTARKYGLELRGQFAPEQFLNLIKDLHESFHEKAVVIIDEYDKPLLTTIDMQDLHIEMRRALKSIFGVLKTSDEHLRFVFLTGVSKFSHVSIFSDLNHLVDLTLDPRYADICGITHDELEQNFEPEIQLIIQDKGINRDVYIEQLSRFYDGYRFSNKLLKVYNPFGLLNHFYQNGVFQSYWYDTGTPTFLINLVIQQKINILELINLKITYENLKKYDIENMEAEPILYQTGYLTIIDYNEERDRYTLGFPNEEVRSSFAGSLMQHYLKAAGKNYLKSASALTVKKEILASG